MDWLHVPGSDRADSRMGHFRVAVQVGDRTSERFDWPFILADGREVQYPVAWISIRLGERVQPTIAVFGESGSEPILGVVTLEEFRLAADVVNRRLVSVPGLLKLGATNVLHEDAADLAVFEARAREPVLAFEEVLKDLKRRGKL